jgi:DNA-binding NtrC family response regulator
MMRDPITVLVVDDDQMIRSVVRIALQRVNDWTVIEAENGSVGVSVAADERGGSGKLNSGDKWIPCSDRA